MSTPSKALMGIILTLLLPAVVKSSSPSQTSDVPTSIVSAPVTSSTSSSSLGTIPLCSRSCLTNATLSLPCLATDTQCLCAHSSEIHSLTLSCLDSSSCSASDVTLTANYYNTLCISLGYPLSATGSATYTSTSTIPSTTSGTSSSAGSTGSKSSSVNISIIVGIAIGAGVIIILALITFLFFLRRRRRAGLSEECSSSPHPSQAPKASQHSTTPSNSSSNYSTPSNAYTARSSSTIVRSKSTRGGGVGGVGSPPKSTVFTMVNLADIERERTGKEKALPPEPEMQDNGLLSPSLAGFNFGIGVARGSGYGDHMPQPPPRSHPPMPSRWRESDRSAEWEDADVEHEPERYPFSLVRKE